MSGASLRGGREGSGAIGYCIGGLTYSRDQAMTKFFIMNAISRLVAPLRAQGPAINA
jgi:hypothetical protein